MLLINVSVKPSPLEGLGLFAEEKIVKGSSIWKFDARWDLLFEPAEVENMPAYQRTLIETHAYLSPLLNKYVFCADDARFMNHSSKRNNLDTILFPGEIDTRAVANRDIEVGEELLINYRTFDVKDAVSTQEYLST